MKIENRILRNRTVKVGNVPVVFDENGCAEVEEAAAKRLLSLSGYRAVNQPPIVETEAHAHGEEAEKTKLESLNTAQLKKIAKERGIDIGDAAKKAELIELIEKADSIN